MMKVCLNKRHLDNDFEGTFYLSKDPCRVAYVPKGDRELPEYIFAYDGTIPTREEEKELFEIPHDEEVKQTRRFTSHYHLPQIQEIPTELWLKYQKATVILITKELDNKFRKENKKLIEELEALLIEE